MEDSRRKEELIASLAEVCIGHDNEQASVFGVGYPGLLSVEHPVVACLVSSASEVKGITATVRLRQAVASHLNVWSIHSENHRSPNKFNSVLQSVVKVLSSPSQCW